MYKWIREGPQPMRCVEPTVGPDGNLRIGSLGQVERVEEEWWKLWQGPEPSMAAIEHLVRPFQRLEAPHRKTALTEELLYKKAHKESAQKAAGPDDWGGEQLSEPWPGSCVAGWRSSWPKLRKPGSGLIACVKVR